MRTKRIIFIVLVVVLLASAVPMAITPAAAIEQYEKKIPGDVDENNELTKDELVVAILPYMLGDGDLKLDDVGDAAWVYAYWNGEPKTMKDQGEVDLFSTYRGPEGEVILVRPVERIVTLNTGGVEAVRSLKAADKLVGVQSYVTKKGRGIFPEFSDYPIVDSKNLESIIVLHPDVALASKLDRTNIDTLESAGVVGFRSSTISPDTIVEGHRRLGYLLDKEDEAEEFIDWYEGILNSIKETVEENIPEENKPTVYWQHCVYEGRKKYTTTGRGVYHSNIVVAGGRNVFEAIGGFESVRGGGVDVEAILDLDPDVIVWCGRSYSGTPYDLDADETPMKRIYEEVITRHELQNMTAVKEKKVLVISTDICCCPGLSRHFVAVAHMAKFFYPDLFTDLNPKAIHQEYLTRFQGLNINLDEKAAFVHPEQK